VNAISYKKSVTLWKKKMEQKVSWWNFTSNIISKRNEA
jgi:hypothetical protein